jgi:hypothetical protein
MRAKPLSETNPFLRDPAKRRKLLRISVSSSTAIETKFNPSVLEEMEESSNYRFESHAIRETSAS